MGVVKLELVKAKNYTIVESDGPRKGRAITFRGDRVYEVTDAQAEILLGKVDPLGNDVFRIVLDEPAPEEEGPKVSMVEKKTREAHAATKTAKAKKSRRKKTKGKKLSEAGSVDMKSTPKSVEKPEVMDPVDGEDPNEGIPDELLQV